MIRNSISQYTRRFFSLETKTERTIKPFHQIPTLKGPFGFGSFFYYLPKIGKYSWLHLDKASYSKYKEFGSIVHEKFLPKADVLWIFEPNDIAMVFNDHSTEHFPRRKSHLALKKYREDREHIYKSAGLIPTNGPEWWRLRSEFQKTLSPIKNVRNFLPAINRVTEEFIEQLEPNVTINILPQLERLNLEIICHLTFGESLNCFSEDEKQSDSVSSNLLRSAWMCNSSVLLTDQEAWIWPFFETKSYKKFKNGQQYMEDFVLKKIEKMFKSSSAFQRESLLDIFMANSKLDLADVTAMAVDLLLAGVDTTSYTTSFLIYYLARNPIVQVKLHEELRAIRPNDKGSLTNESLNNRLPYARACIKETHRLNPISFGIGRILNKDLILSGFLVPKGTNVVTQNMVACRLEKNFEKPDQFIPERWINKAREYHPFLVLPFGHGMRSCIARRLAEQDMLILLQRLILKYKIEWAADYSLDVRTELINVPDRAVSIRLVPRFS